MIRLIAASLSIFFSLISCSKKDNDLTTYINMPDTPATTDTTAPRSYLALGDSYTIGQSVPVTDRYPVQTVKYLNAQGTKFNEPEIIARTGWTTADLLGAIAATPPSKKAYDIVTLLIGVNNQHQERTQSEYTEQFTTLLNMAIQFAGNNKKRVIVLSIPDYSVTPYASGSDRAQIAKEIDSFNVINKSISDKLGVNYLDITGSSRLAANDPSLLANDGLHPSGTEYKVWADGLVPIIRTALK